MLTLLDAPAVASGVGFTTRCAPPSPSHAAVANISIAIPKEAANFLICTSGGDYKQRRGQTQMVQLRDRLPSCSALAISSAVAVHALAVDGRR